MIEKVNNLVDMFSLCGLLIWIIVIIYVNGYQGLINLSLCHFSITFNMYLYC